MEWQQSFPPLDTEFLLIFQKNRVDFDVENLEQSWNIYKSRIMTEIWLCLQNAEKQESPNIVSNFLNASEKQESPNIVLNFLNASLHKTLPKYGFKLSKCLLKNKNQILF